MPQRILGDAEAHEPRRPQQQRQRHSRGQAALQERQAQNGDGQRRGVVRGGRSGGLPAQRHRSREDALLREEDVLRVSCGRRAGGLKFRKDGTSHAEEDSEADAKANRGLVGHQAVRLAKLAHQHEGHHAARKARSEKRARKVPVGELHVFRDGVSGVRARSTARAPISARPQQTRARSGGGRGGGAARLRIAQPLHQAAARAALCGSGGHVGGRRDGHDDDDDYHRVFSR
eukprot:scaffold258_cov354-Prasinococcus_capsulatus_cf.AAC.3